MPRNSFGNASRAIEALKIIKATRTLHGRVYKFSKSSSSLSLVSISVSLSRENYVEDNLTIARLATLIQKRSGGITSRGQALFEAQQKILSMNLAAGAEAAVRIQQQELAALAILKSVWDGCNESATMRC